MPGRWLYGTLLSVGYIEVVGARYVLPDGRVLLDDVNFRVGEGSKPRWSGQMAPARDPAAAHLR